MRIVSGRFKGRKLMAPKNIPARPTTNYAKEALFNVLEHKLEWSSTRFLDLFAGIGSISVEAISRGALEVIAVDRNFRSVGWLKQMAKELDIDNLRLIKADVLKLLDQAPKDLLTDVIFADPPFDWADYPQLIEKATRIAAMNEGLFILEHRSDLSFQEHPNFAEERTYGEVRFTFFNP